MNIVPFDGGGLPDYLAHDAAAATNDDLLAHATASYGKLAFKGKEWSVVKGSDRVALMNPLDPTIPATYVDVVLIKVNKDQSKTYYASGFSAEASDRQKPDCASSNGIAPDAGVASPQAPLCATCPKNEWGSKISEAGKKIKACQDNVRVAVAPIDDIEHPLMLSVPPASIKPLSEYGLALKKRNVGYQMVLTRLGFEQGEATPKLTFSPRGYLPKDVYTQVKAVAESDVVDAILGRNYATTVPALPAPEQSAAQVIDKARETAAAVSTKDKIVRVEEVAAAVAHAAPKAEPAPAAQVVEAQVDLGSVNFDDLSFD